MPKRLPSIKTLTAVFGERAKEARELLEKKRKTRDYKSVTDWEKHCFYRPPYIARLLRALDEIAGTYGVESFQTHKNRTYSYLNTGDTYNTTLLYCYESDNFFVSTWGDIVEREGAD